MHLTSERLFILFCVLLTLGAMLWTVLVSLMAWGMLRPPRMSAGKAIYHLRRLSPGDLGLPFEEENFKVRDARTGLPLHVSGWWIPAPGPSDRCIVLIHGYADAKVGAIAWAPVLNSLCLNILAIDLRAHGDSQGRFSTGGFFERDDVGQAIDQTLNSRPDETRQMMLFGVSLGAAVAVAVAARRTDISALILESPFVDYERVTAAHFRLLGLPGGLMLKAAIAVAKWISGARFEEVRTVDLLGSIRCPVLGILGGEDELVDDADVAALRAATDRIPGSGFWLVENAGHLQALNSGPEEYGNRIGEFLAGGGCS